MAEKKSLKGFIDYLLGKRKIDPEELRERSWRWKPIRNKSEKKPDASKR